MEKQDEILERTAELFRNYGIRSITMDDISHELGISKKTLYQFVTDKDELVKKVVAHILNITMCHFDRIRSHAANAIEELFEVNCFVHSVMRKYSPAFEFDLRKYYPDVYQLLIKTKREKMYDSVLENIRKGKSEGIYREDMEEEVIAKVHVSRMENLHDNTMFSLEEMTRGKIFKEIFVYHIRGMANAKGIKILEENMHKLEFSEVNVGEEGAVGKE
jgi:TetR/AcrR family transcriptional regulator, cholesterol catabolism regulator